MNGTAAVRFLGRLNAFLPRERRAARLEIAFDRPQSVKHLIESLGVPHTEVGKITIDGRTVRFCEPIGDGDEIAVFPFFPDADA